MLFILGLIFGSFINALVWRIKNKKDWVNQRSICPHCKHVLAPKDLIPVISWLFLKGRCRYCKKAISLQYPLVELLTALLFVVSYVFWPHSFSLVGITLFVSWLGTLVLLIALFVYDLKWMLLPNTLVASVTVTAGLTVMLRGLHASDPIKILWAVLAGLLLTGLFWGLFEVSKGKWIGGGDVKIAFALGLLAGNPLNALTLLFVASFIGTVIIVPLLATMRLKAGSVIPFGPLLIGAAVIMFLFGPRLISWYSQSFIYM